MAEQKQNATNVSKSFTNVQFAKCEDKYDIKIELNGNLESVSLEFMNKTNIKTFNSIFTKKDIDDITVLCRLSPQNLLKVISDQLSSTDFINKFCRLFIFSDSKQATAKAEEFKKLNTVPDASGIIEGDEGKSDELDKNESKQELFLLFVLHFNPSKYVNCNYCFMMKEKHLDDIDRFMIKFKEINQENKQLKEALHTTDTKVSQLTQSLDQANNLINSLTERIQRLEQNAVDNEVKMEEIELNFQNNWTNYQSSYENAKACKIGNVVHLKGLVKGGGGNTVITQLPEGWRPSKWRIFASIQDANKACRVNVAPSGNVGLSGSYTSWVSLDNIQFVVN